MITSKPNVQYIDKNSSGDDIANVNFYYDDILREFGEITQNNVHYAVQGHSMSPIGTNRKLIILYDFLLVINSNLPPILHRFRDIAVDRSEIAILGYPSCV